ncbi:AAA family ATPase [Halorussus sp. GCM10023401]|uniref:AAA family ATPase n=1 Tax=Halorussus sp. GCM10023401 TaxID=3252680 RepID=UPI003619FEFF
MRIESLHIENFRGINGTYTHELNGESRVIIGPNGSGKSSILGAIDFLLSGSVTHLSGEGMGGQESKKVVSNVTADDDCLVRCTFKDQDTGETIDVERAGARGDLDPGVGTLPEDLQQLFNTAQQGQHILTRDDILDLIIARPGKRREVLQTMLDLPEIDDQRLALKRTRQDLENQQKNAEASAGDTLERLSQMADADAMGAEAVRQNVRNEVNKLRAVFDGDPVEAIDSDSVRDGIESPASNVAVDALQREQPLTELRDLTTWVDDLEQKLAPRLTELAQVLRDVSGRTDASYETKQLELLELGEEVVANDADVCPLCNQSWDQQIPLHEDIGRRRQELRDLKEQRQKLTQLRKELETTLREGSKSLEYLTRELDAERYEQADQLVKFHQHVTGTLDQLAKLDLTAQPEDVGSLPMVKAVDNTGVQLRLQPITLAVERLNQIKKTLPSVAKHEEQYERIRSLAVEWEQYLSGVQRASEIQQLHDEIETAETNFNTARKEVIGEIYVDIADTIEEYYGRIHPDEAERETDIEVTDTGAEIHQEFHGAGEYPPQFVQSEGHLDTLGLSMYLALSKYLQQDAEALLLLDDIVMSVDNGHRREIAQLLAEEAADQYQLIIATHDELWAEQLRTNGALHGGSSISLREWSLDTGIVEQQDPIGVRRQWEAAIDAMEADEMERAAHELRYSVEQMLQQTCIALDAKVHYKPRQDYTVSDFKDAVSGRLKELTGEAKNELYGYEHHPNSAEREQMYNEVEELKSEYGQVLHDVGQSLQTVNRRVHWSPGKWLTLGPAEFKEVYQVHRRAYELLYCDDCGSSIQYQKYSGRGEEKVQELRCNCRSHYDIRW